MSRHAKEILLQYGRKQRHPLWDFWYEDEFISIGWACRAVRPKTPSRLEVTRKKMPGHPKEHVRDVSNPFFMEHDGEVIRVHGEGIFVYQHIIDLATGEKEPTKWT